VNGLIGSEAPRANQEIKPLDLALVSREGPGSLVAIGQEGRLMRKTSLGSVRVALSIVDETVLALVDLAMAFRHNLTIVYPAPAGEVSVLLAAEILLQRFIRQERSQSIGIVTSDTVSAARIWEQVEITTVGARARISEVFPCFRAGPNGESPVGGRSFRGAIVGNKFVGWPVDVVVIDHLAGHVDASPEVPTIRVFADPSDKELARLAESGELIWGWTEEDLAILEGLAPDGTMSSTPFSVAADRLTTMAAGVNTTVHVAHDADAEKIVRRLRDDLRTLKDFAGKSNLPALMKGIRVAWHHVTTLTSLPCKPSEFDAYAGMPPFAARATRSFEPEIAAWATTLQGDVREIAEIVASDLGDLRAILEETNPFSEELAKVVADMPGTLVVLPTQTAVRAFAEAQGGDSRTGLVGDVRVIALKRLHFEGTWDHVVVVGTPTPWEWHQYDSGLSPDVHVLVLGDLDARLSCRVLESLHDARAQLCCHEARARVWQVLTGETPPDTPELPEVVNKLTVVDALEAEPELDPFEALQPLLTSVPLIIGDEGIEESIAEQSPGTGWQGAVDAVEVTTDAGSVLLPRTRLVDVRNGEDIVTCRAELLQPGTFLIIDRRGGRLGLLEALSERLKQERPDLLAANLLIRELRAKITAAFATSGMAHGELFEKLCTVGFEKTFHTACRYVEEDGPMAPRDFEDLKRLNEVLGLEMSGLRLREVFTGVQRWRGFRRAAGKALIAASRVSLESPAALSIDHETGLSLADLRDLVLEAEILSIRECLEQVPLMEVGHLREG
jgi:hypothetical protein